MVESRCRPQPEKGAHSTPSSASISQFWLQSNFMRSLDPIGKGRQLQPVRIPNPHSFSDVLTPIEVRLKNPDSSNPKFHLLQVKKKENYEEGEQEAQIPFFDGPGNEQKNCLSFYRRRKVEEVSNLKLAICICVYNESKSMLEKSLLGVHKSLEYFKTKAGIPTEGIVVIVIFDGIEKIHDVEGQEDENILTFFDRIDIQNGLYGHKDKGDQLDQDRFENKYRKYCQIKSLLKQCQSSKRQTNIQRLDPIVRAEYCDFRDQLMKKDKEGRHQTEAELKERQDLFDSKPTKKNKAVSMAYQAIKNKCEKFIKATDNTSLVYPMMYYPEQSSLKPKSDRSIAGDGQLLNVLIVVKHKNDKKLSSHKLFFLGFCQLINPEICTLLDVGLEPQSGSIFRMYQYMSLHDQVGGSCGYMGVKVQRSGDEFGEDSYLASTIDPVSYYLHQHVFDIQKAQRFEYHMGHLIDKPFQAAFDFIHVLPGAFSCYRYAIIVEGLGHYLKPVTNFNEETTLQQENIYLAQDRILSLCIKKAGKSFAYLPYAMAVVDPMSDLPGMMAQRRRWINGSWFGFFGVFEKRNEIQDCMSKFQLFYYYMMHGFYYISIGIYFSTIYLTVRSVTLQNGMTQQSASIVTSVVSFVYILIVGALFFLSLNQKSSDPKFMAVYYFASTCLGVYGIMVLVLMLINLVEGIIYWGLPIFPMQNMTPDQKRAYIETHGADPVASVLLGFMYGTLGMYMINVIASFLFVTNFGLKVVVELVLSAHHFLFYAPTYLHHFMIYAFCKVDDFTWGTKGLDVDTENADAFKVQRNKIFKYLGILKYFLCNITVAVTLSILVTIPQTKNYVIIVLGGFFFANTFFRFFFSLYYLICHSCRRKTFLPRVNAPHNEESDQAQRFTIQKLGLGRKKFDQTMNLPQQPNPWRHNPGQRSEIQASGFIYAG